MDLLHTYNNLDLVYLLNQLNNKETVTEETVHPMRGRLRTAYPAPMKKETDSNAFLILACQK